MLCVESFDFSSKVVFQFRSTVSDRDLCVPQNIVCLLIVLDHALSHISSYNNC